MVRSYMPRGRYKVGVRDLSLYPGPVELHPEKHLFGRIFYPCDDQSTSIVPILWTGSLYSAHGYSGFPFAHKSDWQSALIRHSLTAVAWCLGSTTRLWGYWNAHLPQPPKEGDLMCARDLHPDDARDIMLSTSNQMSTPLTDGHKFPVVIFSHGLAGQRNTYSCICMELASQGVVVLAVEHCDGSASVAQLAGPNMRWQAWEKETVRQAKGSWRWYRGLGDSTKWCERTEWRALELRTAFRMLSELNEGKPDPNLSVSGCTKVSQLHTLFRDRLDLERTAVMGHSYGGATATLAASSYPEFKCAAALDPWWDALPSQCPALTSWQSPSPLLVLGSHSWNTPDVSTGKMMCNEERQSLLLEAAQVTGGGALHIVPKGSNHHSFGDLAFLFDSFLGPLRTLFLRRGTATTSQLPNSRAHDINCECLSRFLMDHLPGGISHLKDPRTHQGQSPFIHNQSMSPPDAREGDRACTGVATSVSDASVEIKVPKTSSTSIKDAHLSSLSTQQAHQHIMASSLLQGTLPESRYLTSLDICDGLHDPRLPGHDNVGLHTGGNIHKYSRQAIPFKPSDDVAYREILGADLHSIRLAV
ncbi:hypothetical protein CEUSTIGMA_g6680.t1 [Chlamydomonas eustigma]|uniref:1-alkyl-2-acetylglycerophosphocholine esterase n=1 Tax=Chlamydomonas eustigma TaxID=1157962 RepID=A0A250X8Y6_9CHLO|nr:hypothetical protein CEUSTIGMA_g6680.t1 [Chlamydomonas eustigma]|eukprot:GAX79240.1 hypothetical protein CEUSTIGMA_g6680.t1 [Chlamydomonas eustigma]